MGWQQGIRYKSTFQGSEQPPHTRDHWLLPQRLAQQGQHVALHRRTVTPLWQQHPNHAHEHRDQQLPGPGSHRKPYPKHPISSTTTPAQGSVSLPCWAQLSCCRGQALSCRSEATMGHSSAANMCPCDDFGNRNGLNICSRVVSVFVCQAQRDFSSASAQPFILLCCCQLEAALCDPGPRRAG